MHYAISPFVTDELSISQRRVSHLTSRALCSAPNFEIWKQFSGSCFFCFQVFKRKILENPITKIQVSQQHSEKKKKQKLK